MWPQGSIQHLWYGEGIGHYHSEAFGWVEEEADSSRHPARTGTAAAAAPMEVKLCEERKRTDYSAMTGLKSAQMRPTAPSVAGTIKFGQQGKPVAVNAS